MNSDLIFPIIPRNTKVPVVADKRVKKVDKQNTANVLSEEEKAEHKEERKVSDKEQHERHNQPQQNQTDKPQEKEAGNGREDVHLDIYI